MNKIEALQETIQKAGNEIQKAKKQIEEMQNKTVKRERAKVGNPYFSTGMNGAIYEIVDAREKTDDYLYNTGNYYLTKQPLEDKKRRQRIEQQIKDISLELNDGQKIEWKNLKQCKYSIYYNYYTGGFGYYESSFYKEGCVYCLSEKFLEVVLERIGEKDLKFYFGVES